MNTYNFDREAAKYDLFYKTSPGLEIDLLEKNLVQQFIKFIHREEILEIGCGTGHWTSFFSDQGFHVHGLDISEKMLAKALEKGIPHAEFTLGSAEELPFENWSFANVACITSLEFVGNPGLVRAEIDRVLKPGGILLIGALNENSILGRNRDKNPVFRNAHFFTKSSLQEYMYMFGKPKIAGCIVQDDRGNILDFPGGAVTEERRSEEGAFLVGLVKKSKT